MATSEAGRLIGVFTQPRKTFEEIAERPSWRVPRRSCA